MAKLNVRRPTAVASIAALMALAALPSTAMADEPGWRGNGRAASGEGPARDQPRQDWRNGGEARADSGQSQAERSRVRTEAAQQRPQPEQRSSSADWRGRGRPEQNTQTAAPRPDRPAANRVANERPSWSGSGAPATGNGSEQRRWQGQQQRDRTDAVRLERDRDRGNVVRPDYNRDRSENRPGWTGNRVEPAKRYENGRVVNGQRWDDDRRWSYSNGRYQWNKNWRNDKRYDWRNYRTQYRYIYSPGRYYAPYSNYYYRTMLVGSYLDTGFYGNRYWLNDPWEFRLPAAHGPYRWIRYFDDALLVNIHTGMVVDTIRNFFW